MKLFLIPFLVTFLFGWWASAVLRPADNEVSEESREEVANTSLLGARNQEVKALPAGFKGRPGLVASLEFLESANTASPAMLERWILDLIDGSVGRDQYQRISQLLRKYGEIEPERALSFIAKHAELEYQRGVVIRAWASKDWKAATAKALELEPTGHLIFSVMQIAAPDEALALHDLLKEKGFDQAAPGQFGNLFSHLYESGAVQAADKALEHMLSLDQFHDADHGLGGVFRRWMKDDSEAAWEWADGQDNPAAREMAVARLVDAWRETDTLGALDSLWSRLDSKQRGQLVDQLGNSSDTPQDSGALLDWIETHVESPEWQNKLIAGLVEGLRNSPHPEQLADLIKHVDVSDNRVQSKIQQAVRKWAEVDADGLDAWLQNVEDTNVRTMVRKGVVDQLIRTDPDKALAYLTDGDTGTELAESLRSRQLGDLIMYLDAAPEELISQLPEALQEKALQGYAEALVRDSPSKALQHFESMPESNARAQGIQRSLSYWAVESPLEAATWVDELPEDETRRFAAMNLANSWSRSDLQGALDWLDSQAPGASRDAAAMELAKVQASHDPEDALKLLQSLGPAPKDGDYRRDEAIQQTLVAVAQVDAARAEAAMQQIGLSDRTRERVEKAVSETAALQAHFSQGKGND